MFFLIDDDGGRFVIDFLGYLFKVKDIDYEMNKVYKIEV